MDIFQSVASSGIAGIVVYIIVRPLINNLITSNQEKDMYLKKLVDEHFKHDEERHAVMLKTLREVPEVVLKVVNEHLFPKVSKRRHARK